MNIQGLAELVQDEPVFTSSLLKVAGIKASQIELQLVRWVKSGYLLKLRRGVYVLGKPYRKIEPHPFLIANQLQRGSYVSFQSVLSYYDLIPEHVPVVTSATTGRPETVKTPMGSFIFRHLKAGLFSGFRQVQIADRQQAVIATSEKALVDLLYATAGSDSDGYIEELRLQNTESLSADELRKYAEVTGSWKVKRAVKKILKGIDRKGVGDK
jgi:predicted transcriptional regulator of viral defense system